MSVRRRTISMLRGERVEAAGEVRWSRRRGLELIDLPDGLRDYLLTGLPYRGDLVLPYHGRVFLDALAAQFARSTAIYVGDEETLPEEQT